MTDDVPAWAQDQPAQSDVPDWAREPASKSDFSWGQAITDIPHEIGSAAGNALSAMGNLKNRSSQGPIEGLMTTGRAALAVPELIASPLTGAVRSLIGHPMANLEHAAGTLINPSVAAKDDPAQMYETAKSDVDRAMSAARPAGAPIRTPGGFGWNPPGGIKPVTMPGVPETIGDFAVPLTEGEAQQNLEKIALERRALRAGEGKPAQEAAQNFINQRDERLGQVREDIARRMDPYGAQIAETPQEAGALAGAGVWSAAQGLRDIRNARYEEMANLPGEFHAGAFEGIAQRIRSDLTLGENPVIIDDRTTPFASQALQDIQNGINRLRIQNRADPFGQPNPENIIGVNLQGLDQQRKRLVSIYKDARTWPPNADMRATQAVLRSFDGQVQGAIERGLFSGDPRALDALREARAAHSEYMRTYTSQGTGDDVSRVMQHILGSPAREGANPNEIANYLYGATNIGAKGLSYRLADRLRDVLGANSPEWTGVKQGLWRKLTEAAEGETDWGPQKVVNRISKFLNGDGQATAQRMFSPSERQLMTRYADVLRQTIPPPGTVNFSNNIPMLSTMRHQITRMFTSTLGTHIGGVLGGIAGYGAAYATQPIASALKARKIAAQMPTLADSMRRWNQAVVQAQRVNNPSSPALAAASANLMANLRKAGVNDADLNR